MPIKNSRRGVRNCGISGHLKSLTVLVVAISLGVSFTQAEEQPSRYALLIAVTRYQDATMDETKLVYPEIDAKAVGMFLSGQGYTVEYLLGREATRQAIESKLDKLSGKSDSQGVALIGLWGHGVEFTGTKETMFCPFDTKVRIAKDSDGKKLYDPAGKLLTEPDPDSLVGLSEILAGLQISGAGNRVLLADCCRTSPNKARGRAFGQNVTAADLPDNTLAILACKPDQQAFEHDRWGHGAMTKALLDALPTIANANSDFALNLIGPMTTNVSEMVRDVTGGRSTQTLHQISTGNPRLGLIENTSPMRAPIRFEPGTFPGETREFPGLSTRFCWCPPGEFHMGSAANAPLRSENEDDQEGPGGQQPRVTHSSGFWISQTPINYVDYYPIVQSKIGVNHTTITTPNLTAKISLDRLNASPGDIVNLVVSFELSDELSLDCNHVRSFFATIATCGLLVLDNEAYLAKPMTGKLQRKDAAWDPKGYNEFVVGKQSWTVRLRVVSKNYGICGESWIGPCNEDKGICYQHYSFGFAFGRFNASDLRMLDGGLPKHQAISLNVDEWNKYIRFFSGDGSLRLATEAEWEYAIRAGRTDILRTASDEDSHLFYRDASYLPNLRHGIQNAWGVLAFNSSELCRDRYQPFLVGGRDPYVKPNNTKNAGVLRGGSPFTRTELSTAETEVCARLVMSPQN